MWLLANNGYPFAEVLKLKMLLIYLVVSLAQLVTVIVHVL